MHGGPRPLRRARGPQHLNQSLHEPSRADVVGFGQVVDIGFQPPLNFRRDAARLGQSLRFAVLGMERKQRTGLVAQGCVAGI